MRTLGPAVASSGTGSEGKTVQSRQPDPETAGHRTVPFKAVSLHPSCADKMLTGATGRTFCGLKAGTEPPQRSLEDQGLGPYCRLRTEHLFAYAVDVADLPAPELVENRRRSIAMLSPGAPALNRDEALELLEQLAAALKEVRSFRSATQDS
jgi:hypothetical protein